MKLRTWLAISLGLNVALAAAVVVAARSRGPEHPPSTGPSFTNRIVRVRPAQKPGDPIVIAKNAPFHWAGLESPDYRVYVANLRAIGCPETTVRDIIDADVNEVFKARVQQLVDGVTGRFWELMLKPPELKALVEEKEKELRSMHQEREELLEALLDENGVRTKANQAEQRAEDFASWKYQLDFLTDDKIVMIQEAYERQNVAGKAVERAGSGLTPEEKRRQLKELEAERERAIQAQLTPEEFEEYKLRTNDSAADIRTRLGDLDLSEAEVRALAAAKAVPNSEERIKQLLGPVGYAEYQRAGDSLYLSSRQLTDRFNLPPETAVQIYEVQIAIRKQANGIRSDAQRTVEERQAILQALRAEAEHSISTALGPEVFKTYLKYNGDWLSGFADEVK